MRTIGALRDAQRVNRRSLKERLKPLKADLRRVRDEMNKAYFVFNREWNRLEDQIAHSKEQGRSLR